MSDVLNMMEEDVSAADASSIEQRPGLGRVAELAKAIREKEQTVDNYEEAAKKAKAELLKLTDEDLPALMQEIGLKSFQLDDGATVEIKATYGGHIKAENKPAAFEWLRGHNHGDIIKNIVSVNFGAGEDNAALDFIADTTRRGFTPEHKTDVNPMTLKAWVKERVEKGEEFPMTLFGAFVGQRAVIKTAKKGK